MTLKEDIDRRRAQLSPEQRAILDNRLLAACEAGSQTMTIKPRTDHEPVLSLAQEQQWILNRLHPGNPAYHVARAYRLTGPLNVMVLVRSLNALGNRHEALRTTFREDDGVPVPVVAGTAAIPLPLQDLSHVPLPDREARARHVIAEASRQPFDLERGPLLRAQLLGMADDQHVLALTMHHIVSDDWSMGRLLDDLLQTYEAFCQSQAPQLPALPIQYIDYAAWQRRTLTEKACTPHLAFFCEQLRDAPPVLSLPYDHARRPAQTFRGAQECFVIEPALEKSLEDVGQRKHSTLFMVLMAAFHVLLHRYTRQHDIVVGYPVAGRNVLEVEGVIGVFVNTLVLRTDLAASPAFSEVLAQVRKRLIDAKAHQDLPFAKLVEALQPERMAGSSPIYQVMLILEDARARRTARHPLRVSDFPFDPGVAPLDLMLEVTRTDTGLACAFTYNTDLFDPSTIARMCEHFLVLLQGIVADPDARVGNLPLLTPMERRRILVEWNDTRLPVPADLCLHQLFEAQAERMPDAVALVSGDERLTYRDLNDRANTLACYLRALEIRPEALVGIFLERSPLMIVSVLATLKAGGAYVPLDPAYPAARLTKMLDDAQLSLVLTQSDLHEKLPDTNARVLCVDQEPATPPTPGSPDTWLHPSPDNLAYVIYTSGSTGRPKGVAITHRSTINLVHWARRLFLDDELRGVLCSTSINFDLFVFELFVPLSWGGTVILAENILALPSLPARDQVTLINTVPSAIAELVRDAALPASVTTVNLAGEPLRPELVDRIYDLGVDRVYDLYGPTETTTYSTVVLRQRRGLMTVGRPLANTAIYILDEHRQPVPSGVSGEIYIGGAGLARGYLNRPELTEEKFVPNPFSGLPGDRLYATGDLARYLPDGAIHLLGRIDHQVKIRGFRIELGEIESVLAQHPGVREAAVVTREKNDDKQLVAYVVWDVPGTIDENDLRDAVKRQLPVHMVPAAFVALDGLPRTPNGKVDRNRLPDPAGIHGGPSDRYVAPRTESEAMLAAIWSELLHVPHVGVHDNFFELGGHSLLGARVVARIHKVLQKELPLQALFEYPTVADLAAQLDQLSGAAGVSDLPPLERIPRSQPLPLSFAQERLWFVDRMEPGSPAYNIASKYRMRGALDATLLEQALQGVMDRHEVLRTSFPAVDGEPMQVIAENHHIPLPLEDLRAVPPQERERAAQRLAVDEAQRPFDLATGPVLRLRLLCLGDAEYILVLVQHHIISDGWSRSVFMRELLDAYQAIKTRRPEPAHACNIQYADFAVWQRRCFERPAMARQRTYWLDRLAPPLPVIDLPSDRPRPPVQGFAGATFEVRLPSALADALETFSRGAGATLFMTLLAAFQALLHRYTGLNDIIVGAPIGVRPRTELENLIGLFVNTVALRADISANPSFRELLSQVKETVLGAYANQDLPFEKLVEELHVQRDPGRAPLAQVMFAFQSYPEPPLDVPGLNVTFEPLRTSTAKVDLTLFLHDRPTGLEGHVEYNTDLFDPGTIERLFNCFDSLLQAIVADPECRVSHLPLLSENERRRILKDWNATASDFPQSAAIQDLFEQIVTATPNAIAVELGTERLTYSELNRRANRVAHQLKDLGVEPGHLVGVCLERSAQLVVALVGILKAGAAYMPLSPDYPRDRLAAMLADTRAPVIVTHTALAPQLPLDGQHIVCLDVEHSQPQRWTETNPECHGAGNDLAYVAYTSGSTGTPHGVCVPHQAVSRLVINADYLQLGPDDVVAQVSDAAFDAATFEIWGALLNGARLTIVSKETLLSPRSLEAAISDHGITVLFLTTALFNQVAQVAPGTFSKLRCLLFGGEAVASNWVREVLRHNPPARLLHVYGPTECTTFATWYPVCHLAERAHTVPIGRPIANTEAYVLDAHRQPVPAGVVGELYLGGPGLALGYLNNAELTDARFLDHPFDPAPGARLYRTGDMVRFLPDGNIEFMGRRDFQIKISGFRVELGEIETVLARHHAVRDVAVLCREDMPGAKQLVAYVAHKPESTVTPGDLRAFLRTALPAYMVPSAFVMLESLPLNPHGKIARNMLPPPESAAALVRDPLDISPRSPCETTLKDIWEDMLGVRPIGVHDNFFDIGGNSLLAVQLFARVEKVMGLRVPVGTVFVAPTIAQLAVQLAGDAVGEPHRVLVLMRAGGPQAPLFWIHSVTGRVELYYRLVQILDGDRPMYGVQAAAPPLHKIEDMAAAYVNEIRRVQPAGPYYLGGYCFGGVVAFEVARQLAAMGEEIALLALIESVAPVRRRYTVRQLPILALRTLTILPAFALAACRDLPRAKRKLVRSGKTLLRWMRPRPPSADVDEIFDTMEFWEGHRDLVRVHARALVDYLPKPYSGRATLFKARVAGLPHLDPFMGWRELVKGGVEVRVIPGRHDNLLDDPHRGHLARELRQLLIEETSPVVRRSSQKR